MKKKTPQSKSSSRSAAPGSHFDIHAIDWAKGKGLVPAVVQNVHTREVLMVGWMNEESLQKTMDTGLVTFFSRSKDRLWTKGESSGNFLRLVSIQADCDFDTLLVEARPDGPVCHRGTTSCFHQGSMEASQNSEGINFLEILDKIISERFGKKPKGSYVAKLISEGLDRMAQKVGEEAVETVIAAKNDSIHALESEAADLLFHLMVLLRARGSNLTNIADALRARNRK